MNTKNYYPLFLFTLLISIPYLTNSQSLTLSDSLKAYYNFDRNTRDTSGNQNHLANNSSLKWSTFAGQDSAIYFDGSARTESVGIFDNSYFTSSAIALWIFVDSVSTNTTRVAVQGADIGFGVYVSASNKIIVFFDPPYSSALSDTSDITDGAWHHVVAQSNGDTTYLYVDGRFIGKKRQLLDVGNGSSSNKIYLGKTNLNLLPFYGSINDLRIYNRMLSHNEIDELSTFPCKLTSSFSNLTDATCSGDNNGSITVSVDSGRANYNYTWSNTAATLNVSDTFNTISDLAAGQYYVTITDLNSCSVVDTATITVLDSNNAINDTLNISACDSFIWAQNNQVYSSSGIYMDTSYSALGCDSVYHFLNLSLLNLDLSVVNTGDSLYALQTGNTYQWIDCDNGDTIITGATSRVFKPGISGNFAVIIDNGTCFDTSACNILQLVGLNDFRVDKMVTVYPNPNNGHTHLSLGENFVGGEFKLRSLLGEVVLKSRINQVELDIEIQGSNGIYFLEVFDKNNEKSTLKLVKS